MILKHCRCLVVLSLLVLPIPACAALLINEFLASNTRIIQDPQGEYDDWVEIYNDSNDSIDLAGMYLTDDLDNLTKWQFPSDDLNTTQLPPQGFLLVWTDGDTQDSGLHANFKLTKDGEALALIASDGHHVLDRIVFDQQRTDISYGRDPDDPEQWYFLVQPTPGGKNTASAYGKVATPILSHTRGFYNRAFSLELHCATPEAQVYYTQDGKDPMSASGRLYTTPIFLNRTTCLRVQAHRPGYLPSPVVTHSFLFHVSEQIRSLPIISLVGDPGETFYEPNGVMAIVGGSYVNSVWTPSPPSSNRRGEPIISYNNVLERGLERLVSFEYLPSDPNGQHQINCGIRVHGSDWMRPRYQRSEGLWSGNSKFSLRLYFRGQYGPSWLDYPLFPFAVDRFKSIVLRGGHNDRTNPFIKDELTRRLYKDMGHVSSGGDFANLFINGEYKGYFNPCEHITESFCQSWFDSDRDWDILTMFGEMREGGRQDMDALIDFIQSHDLSALEHYEHVARQVDIDAFIDYLILRLWAGDWDWPHNNWSAASERSDQGQWQFFVWDAEGGMSSSRLNTVYFERLHPGTNRSHHENAYLYHGLYGSPRFRLHFGDRIAQHFHAHGALSTENMTQRFTAMQEQLRGVIPNMDTYVLHSWVPQRKDIFLSACRQEGVYTFTGPQALINGSEHLSTYFQPGDQLSLRAVNDEGEIYYTTDGTDPADYGQGLAGESTVLVARDAVKQVHVPTSDIGNNWKIIRHRDRTQTWSHTSGHPGGVGYERNSGYENQISLDVGTAMQSHTSCYVRIPFTLAQDTELADTSLSLKVQYDDGFVAYLNGNEIARRNLSGTPTWNAAATTNHSDDAALTFESIDVTTAVSHLYNGQNVLALHGLNISTSSSDFLLNAELTLHHTPPMHLDPKLQQYQDPLTLADSVHLKARTLLHNTWSSLTQGTYAPSTINEGLRITELMYHPMDTGNPNDPNLEFIELKNTGTVPINLAQVQFTDGIDYTFPPITLDPNGLILVVCDWDAFEAQHGLNLPIAGQYQGRLDNGGEWIALQDATGQTIQRFRYHDDWYPPTDGNGASLTVIQPAQTDPEALSDPNQWRPSFHLGGTPGWED